MVVPLADPGDLDQQSKSSQTRQGKHEQADYGGLKDHDPDWTSSSGSSSSFNSEDEDEESLQDSSQQIPSPRMKKPVPTSDLKSRLAGFLPQLKQANEKLVSDEDRKAHQIDDVSEDDEQFVEMSLGLGVLTERRPETGVQVQEPITGTSDDEIEITQPAETERTTSKQTTGIQEL